MGEREELKRCPFCGGKAYFVDVKTRNALKMFKIECESCKAQMGLYADDKNGEVSATKDWNDRVTDMPTVDYGMAKYLEAVLREINEKLADDAVSMATRHINKEEGVASIDDMPSIENYDLPIGTKIAYEAMLKERERTIYSLEDSRNIYKHLWQKEKNNLGRNKVAMNDSDFTKIKNIKKLADALFEIFSEKFDVDDEQ